MMAWQNNSMMLNGQIHKKEKKLYTFGHVLYSKLNKMLLITEIALKDDTNYLFDIKMTRFYFISLIAMAAFLHY